MPGQGYSFLSARQKQMSCLQENLAQIDSDSSLVYLSKDYINSLIGGALPSTRFTDSGTPVIERTAVVSSILSIMVA